MRKLKQFTVAFMVFAMVVGMFAGCGKKKVDTSEKVTLKWVFTMAEQKDSELVEKVFNEELAKLLPNTEVEFIHEENIDSKWPLWMAGKQKIDIAWSGYLFDMPSEIENGSYMGLNDLVKDYAPNIVKEMEDFEEAYASATVDGELYAIPCEQPILHLAASLNMDAEFYPYFPVDEFVAETNANYKTTEKAYQIIETYVNALIEKNIVKKGEFTIDTINLLNYFATRGYDFVGTEAGGAWLCYDSQDESGKIVNFMQTEEYKTFVKYTAKWYDNGWIPDSYILEGSGVALKEILTARMEESWFNIDDERGVRHIKDTEGNTTQYKVLTDKEDASYNGASIVGSELTYQTIPYTSENPERAMMLLDLLRDERGSEGNKLYNLLVYGFEKNSEYAKEYGTYHYTLDDSVKDDPVAVGVDYTVQATQASKYGVPHWVLGNVYLSYRTPNILEGQNEWAFNYVDEVKPSLRKTVLYQFVANTTKVTNEVNQVNRAISEFSQTLSSGSGGSAKYQATYEELMKKMDAAGLQKVIDEVQTQADNHMKDNK